MTTPESFLPTGACRRNAGGAVVLSSAHSISIDPKTKITTTYHQLSGHPTEKRVIPHVTGAGQYYATTFGQVVTVKSDREAVATGSHGTTKWELTYKFTGKYSSTVTLYSPNNKAFNGTMNYSGNPTQLFGQTSDVSHDVIEPDVFDPYAGTAVTMDAAALILGILGAPEIAGPAAIIGLGYGIFGFLNTLFGGGGGGGGGDWYFM